VIAGWRLHLTLVACFAALVGSVSGCSPSDPQSDAIRKECAGDLVLVDAILKEHVALLEDSDPNHLLMIGAFALTEREDGPLPSGTPSDHPSREYHRLVPLIASLAPRVGAGDRDAIEPLSDAIGELSRLRASLVACPII